MPLVPPVTVTLVASNSVTTSLNVIVNTSGLTFVGLAGPVIAHVGLVPLNVTASVLDAEFGLPAASAAAPPITLHVTSPLEVGTTGSE